MRQALAALAAVALLAGAGSAADYKPTPIMGIAGPEDFELLPDGKTLVVGQFRRHDRLAYVRRHVARDAGAGFIEAASCSSTVSAAHG